MAPKARGIDDSIRTHAWWANTQAQFQKISQSMVSKGLDFRWVCTRDIRQTGLRGGFERKDWRSFVMEFEEGIEEKL